MRMLALPLPHHPSLCHVITIASRSRSHRARASAEANVSTDAAATRPRITKGLSQYENALLIRTWWN